MVFALFGWLGFTTRRTKTTRGDRSSRRLEVEALEERAVPAAVVLDFEELSPTPFPNSPDIYQKDGFTIDTNFALAGDLTVLGAGTPFDAGSTALTGTFNLSEITLSKDSGAAFDLNAIDLSLVNDPFGTATVTFMGARVGGGTVVQVHQVSNFGSFQTFVFGSDFDAVTSVTWEQNAVVGQGGALHQFDNVQIGDFSNIDVQLTTFQPGNVIQSGSFLPIAVTILSTASFDATTEVNKATITFGATGDENSILRFGSFTPSLNVDVNSDGLADLVVLAFPFATGLEAGDTEAVLKAETNLGDPLQSVFAVTVV